MPLRPKMRKGDKGLLMKLCIGLLGFDVVVESNNLNAKIVEVGEQKGGESPGRGAVVNMLHEEHGGPKLRTIILPGRLVVLRTRFLVRTRFEEGFHVCHFFVVHRGKCLDQAGEGGRMHRNTTKRNKKRKGRALREGFRGSKRECSG